MLVEIMTRLSSSTYLECNSTNIIIAGHFNTVINPTLDRSHSPGSLRIWCSTDIIKQYMNHYGLNDSWRKNNPSSRDLFFHQSLSRIAFSVLSNSLTTIHSIILSELSILLIYLKPFIASYTLLTTTQNRNFQ